MYSYNRVVYFAVGKGRSGTKKLHDLCRFLLLLLLVYKVRVHARWISTKLTPAEYLTGDCEVHRMRKFVQTWPMNLWPLMTERSLSRATTATIKKYVEQVLAFCEFADQ